MAKLLILTPQLPYPPHQGTSLRNFHIIRGLAERHEIMLLSFLEEGQAVAPDSIAPLLQHCTLHTVPVPVRSMSKRLWQLVATRRPDMAHRLYSPAFADKLRQLLTENQYDIVQVEGIELARYMGVIRVVSPNGKIVFDDHNAETELQRRNFLTDLRNPRRWLAAAYSWVQVGRLRRFERWAMAMADGVTAVSETDKQTLEQLTHNRKQSTIAVIPNCIDVQALQDLAGFQSSERTQPAKSQQFDLVFSGKMDYRPNVDAVLWFTDEVWPEIRAQKPEATFAIVGQKPHTRLERLRNVPGVTLTGFVESVTPYLAGASVYIMPFRVGSGTRLKLIEAMAAGKAIVSTYVGAEGFPVQNGREIILAETAEEMGTAVLRLLNNPQERQRLGQAARQFARQYDWRQVIPKFDELFAAIL
ncbi:MAG: glycosyltransferase [Chloroflexi bacterium]|nr:glycosyltransferase [Chloroflexota bacterium]